MPGKKTTPLWPQGLCTYCPRYLEYPPCCPCPDPGLLLESSVHESPPGGIPDTLTVWVSFIARDHPRATFLLAKHFFLQIFFSVIICLISVSPIELQTLGGQAQVSLGSPLQPQQLGLAHGELPNIGWMEEW